MKVELEVTQCEVTVRPKERSVDCQTEHSAVGQDKSVAITDSQLAVIDELGTLPAFSLHEATEIRARDVRPGEWRVLLVSRLSTTPAR